ncbi:hypothetical protein V6N11_004936 [Hibiscus sabdariffa]|uniref:Uncharacterized protein n=1 Tax=Hibiscus sabdariffa TaxID=183260 RepID=A0ABR2SHN0_9ROSI
MWSWFGHPPRCSHWHVFGHLDATCGMLAQHGGTHMGDLQVDLGIDVGRGEKVVGSVRIAVVENAQERDMSITEHGEVGIVDSLVGSSVVQEDVMSENSFDLLVDDADGQDEVPLSPKKSRLAAGGVVDPNVTAISDSLLKEILGVELSTEMADSLISPITRKEIKDVLFAMNGNKAPGSYGYSAKFF